MKKKLFGLLTITTMLLGGNAFNLIYEPSSRLVNDDLGIVESTKDSNIVTKTLDVKRASFIGKDETIDVSPTYIQLCEYNGFNYLRYATAIKGDFSNIYWTRIVDGSTETFEVKEVYKGLTSNNEVVYYTGSGISSDETYSGGYYWAVYTVKFESDVKKASDFTLQLNVVSRNEEITLSNKRTTSLQYELDFVELENTVTTEWSSSIVDRENDFVERGSLTNQTLFMGDSFFDTDIFWTDFYTNYYSGKNARSVNISATTITDWDVFVSRLVYPALPKNLVIHCGTNDLYDDLHSKDVVLKDTQRLLEKIHANLPTTKIYYFGIEPRNGGINGEAIETTIATLNSFNETMKAYCDSYDYLVYLDSPSLCYNADGSVKTEFFRDGVHPVLENYSEYVRLLNEAGIVIDDNTSSKIGNFSTYSNQNVATTNRYFYSHGVQLTNNFVLNGTVTIKETGTNPHIQFDFEQGADNNRFLLWDLDSNGSFAMGYACDGTYVSTAPERSMYTKADTLTLDWKILITQNNAYLYINNTLEVVMINIPQNQYFQIGTEAMSADFTNMSVITKANDEAEFNSIVNTDRIQRYEQLASVDTSRRVIRDYYLDTELNKDTTTGTWSYDYEYDATNPYVELATDASSVGVIRKILFKNAYSTRWYAQMTIQTIVPSGEVTDQFPKMGIGSAGLDSTNNVNNLVWYCQDYSNGSTALTTGEYTLKDNEWLYDSVNSYEWFDTEETLNNKASTMTYGLLRDGTTYYYFRGNNLINVITDSRGILENTPSYAGLVAVGGMGAKVTNYFAKTGAEVDNLLNSLANNVAIEGTNWTKSGQVSVTNDSTFKFGIDEKSGGVKPGINKLVYGKPLNGAFEIEYDISNFYGSTPTWYYPKAAVLVNGNWMCYSYRNSLDTANDYARFETCCYGNWQNSPDFGVNSGFDPLATHHVKITCTADGQIAMYLDGTQIVLEGTDVYNRGIQYTGSNGSLEFISEFAGFEITNFTVKDNL